MTSRAAVVVGVVFGLVLAAGAVALAGQGVDDLPPVVVKCVPQSGDKAVDPGLKELRVTFSKDMQTKDMWSFVQIAKDTYPKTTGKPRFEDARTIVLPVELAPGGRYALWLNQGKFNAFRGTAGHPAVPYLLVFETKK